MEAIDKAVLMVDELQSWIQSTPDLSQEPMANLTYSPYTLSISIGEIHLWDQEDDQLSIEQLDVDELKKRFIDRVWEFGQICANPRYRKPQASAEMK